MGETISRYWSQLNKEKIPRDQVYELKIPTQNHEQGYDQQTPPHQRRTHETNSQWMADMMKDYHEALQKEGGNTAITDPSRAHNVNDSLAVLNRKVTPTQRAKLSEKITRDEVYEALRVSANWKSPGLDGIPYELWKTLNASYETSKGNGGTGPEGNEEEEEDSEQELPNNTSETESEKRCTVNPVFDIVTVLTDVYRDIEEHGVVEGTHFAEGWMCPLYKKNARDEMANYRPLTMLNTDYKLLTKLLPVRLGRIAPTILHESQAGFVKGCQITDQTRLVDAIIDYAEVTATNGLIVALDQEKAYDKIAHNYLWLVLETFNLPRSFIELIQTIYRDAETSVMVNGFLSKPYQVVRGVRQGCPLSCIVFDLAIEALAAKLRECVELSGLKIPQCEEKLIANLFADDTTVFLSANDKFSRLQQILDSWCEASTARFNISKTEIIPIGTNEFRKMVFETRKTEPDTPEAEKIPEGLHIAGDGEAVRILGAWVGNKVNMTNVWSPVLDKVDARLTQWEKGHPTLEGRRLIVQMMAGGVTQYLTQAQGMPKDIERRLMKRIRKFLWADKTMSPVNEETLFAPIETGGRKVLDIAARNEAIEIMRLQRYLSFDKERPIWAYVVDAILAAGVPKTETLPRDARMNVFMQSWKSYSGIKCPRTTRRLLQTAKKHQVRMESLEPLDEVIRKMPIWHHKEADPKIRRMASTRYGKCLREKHKITTVGEMADAAQSAREADHVEDPQCGCKSCTVVGRDMWCDRPFECFKTAEKIMSMLPRKWKPLPNEVQRAPEEVLEHENEQQTVDKGMMSKHSCPDTRLDSIFRIFTKGKTVNVRPRQGPQGVEHPKKITAYISTVNTGTGDTTAASLGIVLAVDGVTTSTKGLRITKAVAKHRDGTALAAIKTTLDIAPRRAPLEILTQSAGALRTLTINSAENENRGYLGIENVRLVKSIVAAARCRQGSTTIIKTKNHGDLRKEAESLAKIAAQNITQTVISTKMRRSWKLTGAKLSAMTQSLAYKHIRHQKQLQYVKWKRTEIRMAAVKKDAAEHLGISPKEADIWKAIRHKDLARTARYYMWMMLHDAYMIETNWLRASYSAELQDRSLCQICGDMETMEHVLFKCTSPGQKKIWEMAKELWEKRTATESWPKPTIGTVVASGLASFLNTPREERPTLKRFYSILMTESAHLIWKLRCNRVIQKEGDPHTDSEVHNKFKDAINRRLRLDIGMTHPRYQKKALRKLTVLQTWKGALMKEDELPDDWTSARSGVLVGINLRENDGRGRDSTLPPPPAAPD